MKTYLAQFHPRRRELFDMDWQFALTNSMDRPENADWQQVQLPHDWSILTEIRRESLSGGMGGFFSCGIGWYRKIFRVEAREQESVELLFDGVWKDCDIWVNDVHVGHHYNGYVSFTVDVTRALVPGDNLCLVRVNNADEPNSRWYAGSGITRPVYIQAVQTARFMEDEVFITSRLAEDGSALVDAAIRLQGVQPGDTMSLSILDDKGCLCGQSCTAAQDKHVEIPLASPKLWSIENPHLYTMKVLLWRGEKLLDEVQERFGVRTIRFDAMEGFSLNGKPVKLNGVCLHHDGGCVGAAVPPKVWRRRFEKLKAMGCNAIRVSHNAPDRAFLDLCDEMGFVVNAELFDEWREVKKKTYHNFVTEESHGYGEVFDQYAEQDALAMVRRDRNHPCIILWSVGNEIPEQASPEGVEIVRWLREMVRSVDQTRPVTTANDNMHADPKSTLTEFMAETDVVGCNYIDRWHTYPERLFEPDKLAHPDWIFYGSEHSSVYGWRGDYADAGETTSWFLAPYASRMLKAEKLMKFVLTRPYICGDFMWTGIDHLGENGWPMKSSISGVIDTAGFEKDGYYFYQSVWVKDRPVLHLFPWLNLNVQQGDIIPFVVYTNCPYVELRVNGKSYGRKAYEFPAQGMKGHWDGFDHPVAEITTNDLHLTWDVPYQEGIIEAVAYGHDGKEICRVSVQTAGEPQRLKVEADAESLQADGRDVIQLEMTLEDAQGRMVPHRDRNVKITCQGPLRLLGMDNGRGDCHIPFNSQVRPTNCGKLYAIVQSTGEAGEGRLILEAEGLEPVALCVACMGVSTQ